MPTIGYGLGKASREDVPVVDKNGLVIFQKIGKGRQWEEPSMIQRTRWAIAAYDADPLNVAAVVIRDLPPLLRADCRDAKRDPERVGLAIAPLLDDNLRSALIANRGDSPDFANLDYKAIVANPEIVAAVERADQANFDLLGERKGPRIQTRKSLK